MGMEQREYWSVNRLATELGVDRRSLARRLEDIEPAGKGPKGDKLYRLRDALDALGESPIAPPGFNAPLRNGNRSSGVPSIDLAERRLYERAGPMATMTGEEICRMFGWSWRDLAELLGWGAPFMRAGARDSARGWAFGFTHFAIWIADLANDVGVADHFEYIPRRLRERRGTRPLHVPTGFRAFAQGKSRVHQTRAAQ
jgi:hypothetical protein